MTEPCASLWENAGSAGNGSLDYWNYAKRGGIHAAAMFGVQVRTQTAAEWRFFMGVRHQRVSGQLMLRTQNWQTRTTTTTAVNQSFNFTRVPLGAAISF